MGIKQPKFLYMDRYFLARKVLGRSASLSANYLTPLSSVFPTADSMAIVFSPNSIARHDDSYNVFSKRTTWMESGSQKACEKSSIVLEFLGVLVKRWNGCNQALSIGAEG